MHSKEIYLTPHDNIFIKLNNSLLFTVIHNLISWILLPASRSATGSAAPHPSRQFVSIQKNKWSTWIFYAS